MTGGPMTPVAVLVGPPGSGKSTVGRLLAHRLRVSFVDTDGTVESRAGKAIGEIFATDGEQAFRELEQAVVADLLAGTDGVLALGGGAVLAEATRRRLCGHRVLFLTVGMAEGVRRTGLSAARPLLTGVNPRATFKALLDARLPLYREVAGAEIDTDGRTVEETLEAALAALAQDAGR